MFQMFAHQITSSAMSIGQMNSPYSRPWLWPVRSPMIPSRNIRFQAQAHDDRRAARSTSRACRRGAGACRRARRSTSSSARRGSRRSRATGRMRLNVSHEIPPKASGVTNSVASTSPKRSTTVSQTIEESSQCSRRAVGEAAAGAARRRRAERGASRTARAGGARSRPIARAATEARRAAGRAR